MSNPENIAIIDSVDPWLSDIQIPLDSRIEKDESCNIRLILKDNLSVLSSNDWQKLISKDKLISISLSQFYQICLNSNLNMEEINYLKDMRRKAQKCKSSLKSQAKMRMTEMSLEKKVELLFAEKNDLQKEQCNLYQEIMYYQSLQSSSLS